MTKAEIQYIRSLAEKRQRDSDKLFVAEGDKLIGEIIDSGLRLKKLYALEGHFPGHAEVISPKEMERISQLKTASTSLAVVEQPHHSTPASAPKERLSLELDGVQNPGNLGTIIRIADWFGIEDIFCSENSADCYNPKVIQATMGAILRVRIHYLPLAKFLQRSATEGTPIYGTMLDGKNIYEAELSNKGVIVMGNEGRGVSQECVSTFSHSLLIPTYPATRQSSESLNVAMATGIVCAEFRRRAR